MPAKKTPETPAKRESKPTPPPEATPHLPKEHWLASDENRNRLAAILKDPVFLAASHYVIEANRLTVAALVTEAMPDTIIARRASVHAGCVEFMSGLKNLTVRKSIPVEPEPYAYIDRSPHTL